MLLAAAGAWYRHRAAIVILGSGAGRPGKGHQRRHIAAGCDEGMSEMRDATNPSRDGSEDYELEAELSHPTDNLPLALTSFVGREQEMAEVEKLLVESRLLIVSSSARTMVAAIQYDPGKERVQPPGSALSRTHSLMLLSQIVRFI